MPTLKTSDGIDLYYVDKGCGPTVVILPGWGTSTSWFENQISQLSTVFRVVAYDPRGQGQSSNTPNGQRMERHARDLEEVLDGLGLEQLILVGWSLGVSTALSYIDVYGTGRLQKLVLVSGCPKMISSSDWALGFVNLPQAEEWVTLLERDMDGAADFILGFFFTNPQSEDAMRRYHESIVCCAGAAAMCWNVLNQDYRDVLSKIDKPTLIGMGRHDNTFPHENGQFLNKSIPMSELVVFDNSGHAPFIEEPDQFNSKLTEFVFS